MLTFHQCSSTCIFKAATEPDVLLVYLRRLLSQLQSYKTDSAKSKTPSKAGAGSADDHITYELYYKPEQAKFSHNARMAEVEQSLERLENLVGQQPEKLVSIARNGGSLTSKLYHFGPCKWAYKHC